MSPVHDTAETSWHLDDDYYDRLQALTVAWSLPDSPADRLAGSEAGECEILLMEESRLLDDDRLEEWLELYTDECCYWIPGSNSQSDPRVEVTMEIHDRRRLIDRITRLRTGKAYSQLPPTRVRHLLTNIELWRDQQLGILGRANCLIYTFRGQQRTLGGWIGFALQREPEGLRISVKQINLIDADQPQENNSFFL